MEKNITCPLCYDEDYCFEDVQETFSSFMCFNCGYMSNSNYTKENLDKIKNTSQLVKDLIVKDEGRDIYWYPSIVNMGKLGIIYPEGDVSNWNWRFARVINVEDVDKEKYQIPGEEGKFYTERLDVDNAMIFGQYEFFLACKAMGIVKDDSFKKA